MNYLMIKQLEKELNGYIRRSKLAYERNDTKSERKEADKLSDKIAAIDSSICIDWPGLYPCFNFKGCDYYSIDQLLSAVYS